MQVFNVIAFSVLKNVALSNFLSFLRVDMATEKAVTYAKKVILSHDIMPFGWWKYWKMCLAEEFARSQWTTDQICGDTETRCLYYFRPPYLCSSQERKYGVPIVSPINFSYTFWRTTKQRKTAQTWDLARLLIDRYSIITEILGFRHSTVLILVFDGVTVKTTNKRACARLTLIMRPFSLAF